MKHKEIWLKSNLIKTLLKFYECSKTIINQIILLSLNTKKKQKIDRF
jgi:hypothetical protein